MSGDRDLAQQWLAERMWKRCPGCSDDSDGWSHVREVEADHLAAAILDTPGVEVREEWAVRLVRSTDGKTEHRPMPLAAALDFMSQYKGAGEAETAHGRAWLWEPSLAHRSVITTPWESAQRSGVAAPEEP